MSSTTAPTPAPRRFHSQPPRFPRMQMCVNQNNNNEELWTGKRRPKRDFHFQVISLPQNQQYYVWPSRNAHDENSNKRNKVASSSSSSSTYSSVPTTYSSIPSTSSGPETPKAIVTPTMGNGVRRGRFAVQTAKAASPAVAIPAHRLSDDHTVSCSAPSDTFKILSISKNVSFDDETDDEEELVCSEVVISRRLSSAPPPSNR